MATQEESSKTPETRSKVVDTGSGAFITGDISTGGGDFIGRDVTRGVVYGDPVSVAKSVTPAQDVQQSSVITTFNLATWDGILQAFEHLIEAAQGSDTANAERNVAIAGRLRDEVMRIRDADDFLVAELLETWCRQAPETTGDLLALFASPLLVEVQGPATRYVLQRLAHPQGGG
jgi:hypothetical protein